MKKKTNKQTLHCRKWMLQLNDSIGVYYAHVCCKTCYRSLFSQYFHVRHKNYFDPLFLAHFLLQRCSNLISNQQFFMEIYKNYIFFFLTFIDLELIFTRFLYNIFVKKFVQFLKIETNLTLEIVKKFKDQPI